MAVAAQRRIMERPLDESRFSGGSHEYDSIVQKYTKEIGKRYRALADNDRLSVSSNSVSGDSLDAISSIDAGTEVLDEVLKEVRDLLDSDFEPNQAPKITFTPTQEWEGFITFCDEQTFTAKVCNVKDPHGLPADEVEFEIRELGPGDREGVKVGAIVRWAIGLERHANDRRQRVSKVHLRRLPVFTRPDIEKAKKSADLLLEALVG